MGVSISWWYDVHNQHHENPNDLEKDPHTLIPLMVFSKEKFQEKRKLVRAIIRSQALYYIPLMLLEGIGIKVISFYYVITGKIRYRIWEGFGVSAFWFLYPTLLLLTLSPIQVIGFVVIHQGLMGLYMGGVFAPNHKGMPLLEPGNNWDKLRRQVLTTRNIHPNPVIDFLMGGLNYQIEHHIASWIPRNKLGEARKIVREFCQERDIYYHETGLLQCWREILGSLHAVTHP